MPNPFANPPWLKTFLSHLPSPQSEFALATLTPTTPPRPSVRTCIFRGPLFSLPSNGRNPIRPINPEPSTLTSSLLTFTTDARMSKFAELSNNANAELCFWLPAYESKPQWRFRGRVYFFSYDGVEAESKAREAIASDIERGGIEGPEDAVVGADFVVNGNGGGRVSWRNEVLRHFANLGPGMRGMFANPAPGTMLEEEAMGKLGRKVEDWVLQKEFLGDKDPKKEEAAEKSEEEFQEGRKVLYEALKNFRLAVVKVEGVDRVDLGEREGNGKRWVYERGAEGWDVNEVWP